MNRAPSHPPGTQAACVKDNPRLPYHRKLSGMPVWYSYEAGCMLYSATR